MSNVNLRDYKFSSIQFDLFRAFKNGYNKSQPSRVYRWMNIW